MTPHDEDDAGADESVLDHEREEERRGLLQHLKLELPRL